MSEYYIVEVPEGAKAGDTVTTLCEVVRCRDCIYRCRTWNGHCPNFIGSFFCAYTGGHEVKPDGFCAWGERRDV